MENFTKALSHHDRVVGRVISGGSRVSRTHQVGKTLVNAIENGFFEKKEIEGIRVARPLAIPFTLFNAFKEMLLN